MSSKRAIRRRACTGKRAYPSEAEAISGCIALKIHSGDNNIRAYKCKFCRQWHTGHYRRRVKPH